MIRDLYSSDENVALGLLRDFHNSANLEFEFDAAHMQKTLRAYITIDTAAALALDVEGVKGLLLGHVAPHPFWPVQSAFEAVWYVSPGLRAGGGGLALLKAFEAWSVEKGAKIVGFSTFQEPGPLGRLLEIHGYKKVDVNYMKVL